MPKKLMDFAAIDFETANYEPTSACSVGVVVVKDGNISKILSSLIRPEPFWFLSKFTDIHGIKAEDTYNSPCFSDLWPEINKHISGLPLVAHNATFDRKVLLNCLKFYGIEFDEPEFFCTVRMSRRAYPEIENHRLDTVCRNLDIALDHHRAESDAIGCAKIVLEINKIKDFNFLSGRLKKIVH